MIFLGRNRMVNLTIAIRKKVPKFGRVGISLPDFNCLLSVCWLSLLFLQESAKKHNFLFY